MTTQDWNDVLCEEGPKGIAALIGRAVPVVPDGNGGLVLEKVARNIPSEGASRAMVATAKGGSLLRVVSGDELLRMDIPRPAMLLDPWLTEKGLAMVHGFRGLGKSWLAMSIAVATAHGGSFLGWTSSGSNRVVFVDGEMPGHALQERLRLVAGAVGADTSKGRLDIIAADLQDEGIPSLSTPEGQSALEPHLEGAALIVVDNLATLAGTTLDSNSDGSWAPMQAWLLRQRRLGRAVNIVHHSGKGGLQRGTSAREDVLDAVIGLHGIGDGGDAAEGLRARMTFEKSRGIRGEGIATAEIVLLENADGVEWVRHEAAAPGKDPRVGDALSLRAKGSSEREIADIIGVGKTTVHRWLKQAS